MVHVGEGRGRGVVYSSLRDMFGSMPLGMQIVSDSLVPRPS